MKTIGIIGGLGPEATVDYYKRITSFFHEYNRSLSTPEIIIYSIDLAELFELVEAERWEWLTYMLKSKLMSLRNAGANFAAISANTPHIVFDRLSAQSPLPLISIVEVTLEAAKKMGVRKVGLLGTKFTMQTNFFGERFSRDGIEVFVPGDEDQRLIQEKLVSEIELGIVKEETREAFRAIIQRMNDQNDIEAVILGCTELPLVLGDGDADIPFLNTTEIHVDAICRCCLGK